MEREKAIVGWASKRYVWTETWRDLERRRARREKNHAGVCMGQIDHLVQLEYQLLFIECVNETNLCASLDGQKLIPPSTLYTASFQD